MPIQFHSIQELIEFVETEAWRRAREILAQLKTDPLSCNWIVVRPAGFEPAQQAFPDLMGSLSPLAALSFNQAGPRPHIKAWVLVLIRLLISVIAESFGRNPQFFSTKSKIKMHRLLLTLAMRNFSADMYHRTEHLAEAWCLHPWPCNGIF